MAHTLTEFAYHIVYSTKDRRKWLCDDLMDRLVPYTGGIIRQRRGSLLAMNGSDDHVHILCVLPPVIGVSKQVQDVKSITSGWIKDTLPNMRQFAWQEGYGGFVVPPNVIASVKRYITAQRQRHHKQSFEDQYIGMLNRAGIEYDPRFVFG